MRAIRSSPGLWARRTLLITDGNLGEDAYRITSASCGDLTWLCWDRSGRMPRAEALKTLAGRRWELAISFYSDLVLPRDILDAIRLPLNIHPALPCIRGVGHDIVPIVEGHTTIGATLHRMVPEIDRGTVYLTVATPIPRPKTYENVRRSNQLNSLVLLERLCGQLRHSRDVADLEAGLRAQQRGKHYPWGQYYSGKRVAILAEQNRCGPFIDPEAERMEPAEPPSR